MQKLKRVLDVEAALSWAFVEELPKRRNDFDFGGGPGYPSVSPMFSMCALGGRVDNWTREPGFPAAAGSPHPDALLIEDTVNRLAAAELSCETADFAAELLGLEPDAAQFWPQATGGIVNLVRIRARLGDRPSLGDAPVCGPWKNENGTAAVRRVVTEWDGDTPRAVVIPSPAMRKGVYHTGAYSPLRWSPNVRATLLERAEYLAWHTALVWIAGELELDSIRVTSPNAVRRPWAEPAPAPRPLVVPDLRVAPPAARRRRKLAA